MNEIHYGLSENHKNELVFHCDLDQATLKSPALLELKQQDFVILVKCFSYC